MTTTTSTFTPSTQILEAGEQAQELSDAGKALKPFLPQEAQQTIQGVEKVANALNATGQALQHFGFDEAEADVTTIEQRPIVIGHPVTFEGLPKLDPHSVVPTLPRELPQDDPEVQKIIEMFGGPGEEMPESIVFRGFGIGQPPLPWAVTAMNFSQQSEIFFVQTPQNDDPQMTWADEADVDEVVGAIPGAFGGILEAMGFDEAEPYIPEVAVDPLA